MSRTEQVSGRVDPETKRKAERILESLGMSTSSAISMFFRQVVINRGLPFEVRLEPNETTRQALEDAETGEDLETFESLDEMADEIDEAAG